MYMRGYKKLPSIIQKYLNRGAKICYNINVIKKKKKNNIRWQVDLSVA